MSSKIKTTNPYNLKPLETYTLQSKEELKTIVSLSSNSFESWRKTPISQRIECLTNVAHKLSENMEAYAKLITNEMGKPITESMAEVKKCVLLCDFYSKNAENLLADTLIETDAKESFISYDPLGTILGIMPWNYPFWQVMRFAVPTLTAGNTILLKHASNVTGCALVLQKIFESSGYPKGCFQTLITDHNSVENLIKDNQIKAISLTGSEKAGRQIAAIAGKNLKKTVLELGGNNACVVLKDANLDIYLDTIVKARMQNTGQSCIAAKRFIVVKDIYDEFLEQFTTKIKGLKSGDPIKEDTEIGVLAREDLADILERQIKDSVKDGAKIHYGNTRDKTYYEPTILTNVNPGMSVFDEETFGPVAAIIKAENRDEAYKLSGNTKFGLGTMVFTEDLEDATNRILEIEDGAFFINDMVKSDPRLPFGGTKSSGYGRELSKEGILEFVNKKTVHINKKH